MGRHTASRRSSRSKPRFTVAAVTALLVTSALVILSLALNNGPLAASPRSATTSTSTSAAPATVVPGVDFTTRLYTLPELKKRFAAKGMSYVTGNPSKPTTFVSSSFNILGSSHAGNGPGRAARAGSLVRAKGVSVVGLQEFQSNQRSSFLAQAGMESYPSGRLEVENSIAWDPDVWQLVEGRLQAIPYFFGKNRSMPLVLLRNVKTGRLIWWMNVHNPADVFGCKCGGWRAKAISVEIARMNALHADGTPVFFTGDLNDRSAVVCRVAVGAGMTSADGSYSNGGKGGSCRPSGSLWIDWIWGSDDQVSFSDYSRDYRTRNSPKISDHPMISATATIEPATDDGACTSYLRHDKVYWFCPDPTLPDPTTTDAE
jgi:hypothetical protein